MYKIVGNDLLIGLITNKMFALIFIYLTWRFVKFTWQKSVQSFKKAKDKNTEKSNLQRFGPFTLLAPLFCISILFFMSSINNFFTIPEMFQEKLDPSALADAKDPKMVCGMGCGYLFGYGTEKNYDLAKKFFEAAAKMDFAGADYMLGFMYQSGLGVEKNLEIAREHFIRAANKNDAKAQLALGFSYLNNSHKPDVQKGMYYLKLSANQNYDKALFALGEIYFAGEIVNQDIPQAKKYYSAAAKQNESRSQVALGLIYLDEKNYAEAKKYLETAANQNNSQAQEILGQLYFEGLGVPMDLKIAKQLFEKAACQDSGMALTYLGLMYLEGLGVNQNSQKAISYFEKSANMGTELALSHLSMIYIEGFFVKEDLAKAKHYLTLAAPTNENAKTILAAINDPQKLELMKETARVTRKCNQTKYI